MKTVEDILVAWEADCYIDDNHLGESSTSTAKLHAKYLRVLIEARMRRAKIEAEYNNTRKLKFRYYRGEMTRKELEELGWEQWQYAKPLKAEMDEILKGDGDLAKLHMRLEYVESIIYALESIMQQIKQRDWQIKNSITWKQFLAGS